MKRVILIAALVMLAAGNAEARGGVAVHAAGRSVSARPAPIARSVPHAAASEPAARLAPTWWPWPWWLFGLGSSRTQCNDERRQSGECQ